MNYTVSVVHGVDDINGAVSFLCQVLGFQQKEASTQAVIVDNGVISIRLVETAFQIDGSVLTLEFQTQDFNPTLLHLLRNGSIRLIRQDVPSAKQERIEALLQAPFGFNILLTQQFDEDQLDIMPALPAQLIWDEDADSCIRKMLRQVPVTFRQAARIRVTERAEMLAGEVGSITVSLDTSLRALAQTTPLFQRQSLLDALNREGIDPADYFEDCAY